MVKHNFNLDDIKLLVELKRSDMDLLRTIQSYVPKSTYYQRLIVAFMYELKFPELVEKYNVGVIKLVEEYVYTDLGKPEIVFKNDHPIYAKLFDLEVMERCEAKKLKVKITQVTIMLTLNHGQICLNKQIKDLSKPKCLHDSCSECKGTGRKSNGTTCVHYISCPCEKCTPVFIGIDQGSDKDFSLIIEIKGPN